MVNARPDEATYPPVDVAICIDHDALTRLRPVVRHLCVGLVDHSAKVRVITPSSEAAPLEALGPIHVFVHQKLAWPVRRSRFNAIVRHLSSSPPSIIYGIASGSFPLAASLAEAFDVELVLQLTATRDVEAAASILGHPDMHRITASEPLLQMLRQRDGESEETQTLIRPGVLGGSELTCFRDQGRTPSLVCTAPLDEQCGVHLIIAAAQIIRDHQHPLCTFLLGEGRAEAGLRRDVRARRLSAQVTFARPAADAVDILRDADILVIAPGDEDLSARPLQAMANGTAVIGFEGGVADYLRDGETSVVCQERTASALAHAIESLLLDHERAHRLAENARAYVKQHHATSAMADQTMAVLRRIVLRSQTIPMPR